MASSISARQKGDSWQALFFWQKAASLLKPSSPIVGVRFEDGPKGFDDVVIEYDQNKPRVDSGGCNVLAEHYQCKWHVGSGTFGWLDLIDPKYINASSVSLMQNLASAVTKGTSTDRFIFVTTDRPDGTDHIVKLIGNTGGELILSRLFDSTGDRSKMGIIRKAWREHLGVDDQELREILNRFSIQCGASSIEGMIDVLNPTLTSVGLKDVDQTTSTIIYDDVIWKWHAQGNTKFSRSEFESLCSRENLLIERQSESIPVLGIRSFLHPIDDVSLRSDNLLDLAPLFDGRKIRKPDHWDFSINPKIRSFLTDAARQNDVLRLILDTHYSIAVAAGYTLNVKSGKTIEIEQRTAGRHLWSSVGDQAAITDHDCAIEVEANRTGTDIVLDISLSRDISSAVDNDVSERELKNYSYVRIRPKYGVSSLAVRDSDHAHAIAEVAITTCLQLQSELARPVTVHMYYSGPNALAFFIGQHALALKCLVVYEWDFEQLQGGKYRIGITLTNS